MKLWSRVILVAVAVLTYALAGCGPVNITVQQPATSGTTTPSESGLTTTPGVITGTGSVVPSVPVLTLSTPTSSSPSTTATVGTLPPRTLPFTPEPTAGTPGIIRLNCGPAVIHTISDFDFRDRGGIVHLQASMSERASFTQDLGWYKGVSFGVKVKGWDGSPVSAYINEMWAEGNLLTVKAQVNEPCIVTVYVISIYDPFDEWEVVYAENRLPTGYALTGGGVKSTTDERWILRSSYPSGPTWLADMIDMKGVPKQRGVDFKTQAIGIRPKNGAPAPMVNIGYVDGTNGMYPTGSFENPPAGYDIVGVGAIAANGASGIPSVLREVYVDGPSDARSSARSSGMLWMPGQTSTLRDYGYMRTLYILMPGATYRW